MRRRRMPQQSLRVNRADTASVGDFSVFTIRQKRTLILSASFISWLSPLSAGIYYPALNQVGRLSLRLEEGCYNVI